SISTNGGIANPVWPGWNPALHPSVGDVHQLFAEVSALEHALEGLHGIFQPFGDCLAVFEIATGHLFGEQPGNLLVAVLPLGHQEEAVFGLVLAHSAEHVERRLHLAGILGVVGGYITADRHPRALVQQLGHRPGHLAADVLEVHIDAIRAGSSQVGLQVPGLVVDASVKAQHVYHEAALLLSPGDAHHAAAELLRRLAHHTAHRTGRRRHHHGFAGLGLADIGQAAVTGASGHAGDAQVGLQRDTARLDLVYHRRVAGNDAVLLPAGVAGHQIPFAVIR